MTDRKTVLKRLLFFLILFCFFQASLKPPAGALFSASSQDRQPSLDRKYETTIRNLTGETIPYTLRRINQDGSPIAGSLQPDGLDRWPCTASFGIFSEFKGNTISLCLECGTTYTFRYDQNDKIELYIGSYGQFSPADLAPFAPTPMVVVERMLELAEIDRNDVLYDLGCGDGRIVITAAKEYGARGVGIDIDPGLIDESIEAAKAARVEGLVEFYVQDIREADFSGATIVTLYLLPESVALLRPLLEKQLKPGSTVVSHNYLIPGWKEEKTGYVTYRDGTCDDHVIYVYKR